VNLQETAQILRICKAEWPQSFAKMSAQDGKERLQLWATMFADDDVRLVGAAVKTLIAAGDREFAPGVGQIKEQMRKLVANGEKTEAEAWARILKAIRNSAYDSARQFERLPPILQKIVGSPSQLREWGMMDSETLHSVVASNVQRAYRTMQQRENETKKIPSDVKAIIADFSARYALNGCESLNLGARSGELKENVKLPTKNFDAAEARKTGNYGNTEKPAKGAQTSGIGKCIAEFSQKFALEENSGRDNGRKNARIGGISDGN